MRSQTMLAMVAVALPVLLPQMANARSNDLSQVIIDVSSNNNLAKIIENVRDRQIELVLARATIGLDQPDTSYVDNMKVLKAHFVKLGAYHALYPTHPGDEQAIDFLNTVRRTCVAGDMILLAVDWEKPVLKKFAINEAPARYLEDFVVTVKIKTGKAPLIYTGPDIIKNQRSEIGRETALAPLWLSNYYTKFYKFSECKRPGGIDTNSTCSNSIHGLVFPDEGDYKPWTEWAFWQFSGANKEDPAYLRNRYTRDMPVDVSFFGGGREDFRQFVARNSVKCEDIPITPIAYAAARNRHNR